MGLILNLFRKKQKIVSTIQRLSSLVVGKRKPSKSLILRGSFANFVAKKLALGLHMCYYSNNNKTTQTTTNNTNKEFSK